MKNCDLHKELLYKSVIHIRHYLKFCCENLPITFKDLAFSQQWICRFHNNMVLEHRSTMATYQQGVHSPYLCVVKDPSEFWRNSFQTDEDLSQTVSATDLCHLYFNTLPLRAEHTTKICSWNANNPYRLFFSPFLLNAFRNWTLYQGLEGFARVIARIMQLERSIKHTLFICGLVKWHCQQHGWHNTEWNDQ